MFVRSESTIQQRNVVLSELVITNTGKKTVLNTVLHYFVNRNHLTMGVLLFQYQVGKFPIQMQLM